MQHVRYKGQSEQVPSASKALETGMEGSRIRYLPINSPMRTCRSENPQPLGLNSIPRPANYAQTCHSSNNNTPKPLDPHPTHSANGTSPVGGQLTSLHAGSVCLDGLRKKPLSVTDIGFPSDPSFSRDHGTTRTPRVFAEATTVLAIASNRRCFR